MLIDPTAQITFGFIVAAVTYLLVRLNIHPPICLCSMVAISFLLGIFVTILSENPQNAMLSIAENTLMFVIGNVFGLIGGAIFEFIVRIIRQVIEFLTNII